MDELNLNAGRASKDVIIQAPTTCNAFEGNVVVFIIIVVVIITVVVVVVEGIIIVVLVVIITITIIFIVIVTYICNRSSVDYD